MNRDEAEITLKKLFGIDKFYDEQWETVDKLLKGERVLLIQRTGFGKSLCFQFVATQYEGITIIFSPLIALMRDQVKSLQLNGIAAAYLNSEQTDEEYNEVISLAIENNIKILYIAPERMENKKWNETVRQMKLSMVVVDEAHTISEWGHDFRPAFKRIIQLVQLLPADMPVLATTATANKKVQMDIETQITGKITTLRGKLLRPNFHLFVIETKSEEEKYQWLGDNLKNLPGNGLIYTGTRVDSERYANWLNNIGVNCVNYNGGFEAEKRKEIENSFMTNKWKCIVSTNALGMGIDKSDIRFIIHTQIPQSPIHYYQEIGRAGRDGKAAYVILFFNSDKDDVNDIYKDCELPLAFIEGSKPKLVYYNSVINLLKSEPLKENEIIKKSNLKQKQVRIIKADLIEQGIIKEVIYNRSKTYEYQRNAPELDSSRFEKLRKQKLKDLDSMVEYVFTKQPRMKYLCEFLEDTETKVFTNCDNTKYKKRISNPSNEVIDKYNNYINDEFPILELSTKLSNLSDGIASSFYGSSNVGNIIHKCKYETKEDFPDFLLNQSVKAIKSKLYDIDFDMMLYIPPTISKDLVKNFVTKLSDKLDIPLSHILFKNRETEPQKIFTNNYLKKDNIKGAFSLKNEKLVKQKTILLVDDICDSGTTLKEIGSMLTKYGAIKIVPFTIAKTISGDI